MTVVGCDDGGTTSASVPEWAHGPWYNYPSGTGRVKVAEISSTQLILYKPDGSKDLTAKFIKAYSWTAYDENDVYLGKGETVEFEYGREFERGWDDTVTLMAPSSYGGKGGPQIFR